MVALNLSSLERISIAFSYDMIRNLPHSVELSDCEYISLRSPCTLVCPTFSPAWDPLQITLTVAGKHGKAAILWSQNLWWPPFLRLREYSLKQLKRKPIRANKGRFKA